MSNEEHVHAPMLKRAATPQVLPFHPTPPVICGVVNKQLLVFSRDEARKSVVSVTVDTSGNALEHGLLPIDFVEGSAQCANKMFVLGSKGRTFHTLQLDSSGSVLEDVPLLIGADLIVPPRLACGYGRRYELWVDSQGQLHVSQDKNASTKALTGITLDLLPLVTPTGLTLVRTVGIPGFLECIRWENGDIQQTVAIESAKQGYCPLLFLHEKKYVLIWIARPTHSIQMQTFDSSFTPQGPAQTLIAEQAPNAFRWIRGIQSDTGKILLVWQTEEPGVGFSETGEPVAGLVQRMAPLDLITQQLDTPTAIGYEANSYFTGSWLEDRFIFILGGGQATILVYTFA